MRCVHGFPRLMSLTHHHLGSTRGRSKVLSGRSSASRSSLRTTGKPRRSRSRQAASCTTSSWKTNARRQGAPLARCVRAHHLELGEGLPPWPCNPSPEESGKYRFILFLAQDQLHASDDDGDCERATAMVTATHERRRWQWQASDGGGDGDPQAMKMAMATCERVSDDDGDVNLQASDGSGDGDP